MAQPKTEDVMLTDEVRGKLKGFLGFQVEAAFKYTPKAFRENDIPKELWPIWTLKSKDGVEAATVEDDAGYLEVDTNASSSKFHPQSGSMRLKALRRGILAVKNFILDDGDVLDWDQKTGDMVRRGEDGKKHTKNHVVVDAIIKHLTPAYQMEIQNAINERDVLSPEELRGLG